MTNIIQDIPLKRILVNPNNPRFNPVKSQTEAICRMLEMQRSEIKNLAIDIAKYGLNPSKAILVSKHSKTKFITLDGNRRITCLLLLHNPNKAKDETMKKFFTDLKNTHSENIQTTVPCFVAENKEALHWVMLEHTGKNKGAGTSRWGAEEKTRFILSNPQLQQQARYNKAYQVFQYADKKQINREGVDLSTFERLVSNSDVRKELGLDFPDDTLVISDKTVLNPHLEKIFQKMSESDFSVRDINRNKQCIEWFNNVVGSSISYQKRPPASGRKKSPTARKSTERTRLIPKQYSLNIQPPKINDIFLELRDDLPLGDTSKSAPNAVGVLFRVFLEVSIDHYLQTIQADIEKVKLSKKIKMITKFMADHDIANERQLSAIRQTTQSDKTDVLHIDRFNEVVHSTTITPLTRDLKENWNRLQDFMTILWNDVNQRTPSS